MAAKKIKYLHDGVWRETGRYVRLFRENREWVVQVWNGPAADGDPAHDIGMPGRFPADLAVEQTLKENPIQSEP